MSAHTPGPDLLATLEEFADLVAEKFDWADTDADCPDVDVSMCTECRSNGCISDKLKRARAAIVRAKGEAA